MLLTVPTRVPSSPAVATQVPSVPSIPTEAPFMYGLKQVSAVQGIGVSSSGLVKNIVGPGGVTSIPGSNGVSVSGAASLAVRYARAAVSISTVSGVATVDGVAVRSNNSTAVTGTAALRAVYTRGALSDGTITGTTTTRTVYRDDFNDGLTSWQQPIGSWSTSGGLLVTDSTDNAFISRPITPTTTVVAEASATAAPVVSFGGLGIVVFTSPALTPTSSLHIYARADAWRMMIDNSNDATASETLSFPLSTRVEVTPGVVKFYVNNSLVSTQSRTVTVYGFGIRQNSGSTGNRIDWVEAR